jgi:hypothetical protein
MEGEARLKDAEVASLDAGLRERGRQLEAEQGEWIHWQGLGCRPAAANW